MGPSDETLVLGVLNGDRAAFAELYDRRARLVRAVCYDETRDLHTAADLTQEAFLRAYRDLGRLQQPDRFGAWLVGIARQVCREWRRSRRRDERRLAGLAAQHAQSADADPRPDERLVAVRDLLAGDGACDEAADAPLTDRERLAVHTFYLQGRNVEEARTVLGLSRSGFYRVLSSAVTRLRGMLTRQEAQS